MLRRPGLLLRHDGVILGLLNRVGSRPGAASAPRRDSHPETLGESHWDSGGRDGILIGPVVEGAVVAGRIPLRNFLR